MGTDIHGWVEIMPPYLNDWHGVINICSIIGRNYDAFGCLFGIKNFANFEPIAPRRGLPADLSVIATRDHLEWLDEDTYLEPEEESRWTFYGETWIGLDEIKAIDWDEKGTALDQRVHEYKRNTEGNWSLESKSIWPEGTNLTQERAWEQDGTLYRIAKIQRKDVLSPDWKRLFQMMELLKEDVGSTSRVRLVIWFDS